jgi:hypothetical protein
MLMKIPPGSSSSCSSPRWIGQIAVHDLPLPLPGREPSLHLLEHRRGEVHEHRLRLRPLREHELGHGPSAGAQVEEAPDRARVPIEQAAHDVFLHVEQRHDRAAFAQERAH